MNLAHRIGLIACVIASSLFATSCSSMNSFWSHREKQESAAKGVNLDGETKSKTVTREQYEELARKYQELLNASKTNPSNTASAEVAAAPPAIGHDEKAEKKEQMTPEVATTTAIDPSELVNHIDQKIPDQKPIEGVEIVDNKTEVKTPNKAGPPVPEAMGVQNLNYTDDVDDQIVKLREATDLIKVNKFEGALTILKELENSKEKQVVVRAKLMLGDLLFGQGEYDLAMQVYEEIVKKYAFSGYVLKALGKLVACSEKLKLPEKQAKYYSLLHDFFEAV